MVDDILESKKQVSRMFKDEIDETCFFNDEELAVHIYHRFNICRDTLEDMPAFDAHIKSMFCQKKKE